MQEEIDAIESQLSQLQTELNESLQQVRTKVNEKASKKDVETNLCK